MTVLLTRDEVVPHRQVLLLFILFLLPITAMAHHPSRREGERPPIASASSYLVRSWVSRRVGWVYETIAPTSTEPRSRFLPNRCWRRVS